MKLHEYQSKAYFARFGILSPPGKLAQSPEEAEAAAQEINKPVIVKAQVLTSSRSLSGGFKFADTPRDAFAQTEQLLSTTIEGLPVREVLVEEAVTFVGELFIAITNDRNIGKPVLVAAEQGGVNVEGITSADPSAVRIEVIEPLIGLRDYQIRRLTSDLYLDTAHWQAFYDVVSGLYRCYVDCDATLAEINPLALMEDGRFFALDGKLYIDDNALFRQPDLAALRDLDSEATPEAKAHDAGIIYHKLNGQIGCLVNGAGLAMTIMDLIHEHGHNQIAPANFLDIGGGAESGKIREALNIIVTDTDVKVVLVNIFGGITHCDSVATAIIHVWQELQPEVPLVVRLQGTHSELAHEILGESNLQNVIRATTLTDVVRKAVDAVREQVTYKHDVY